MKEFLLQMANGAGQNVLNLIGVSAGTYLVTILGKGFMRFYKYLINKKVIRLITKFIPQGIAFGDILKGTKPNHEVLFQAVLRVQNLVLKAFPPRLRPTVDRLIDEHAIAREIERALNEDKSAGLAKAPAMEE
nr:MAG TPA: hypothetical protein [Caudoviricetes sp.]